MYFFRRHLLPLATIGAILILLGALVLSGVSEEEFYEAHSHGHHAPHGGTLIVLGMHEAHIELVLDEATGKLDLYPLDRHGSHPLAMPAQPVNAAVRLHADADWVQVALLPEEDAEHPQTKNTAMRFGTVVPELRGQQRFEIKLPELNIVGQRYAGLTTWFPEGNE